jgi:hypothetical protein
LSCANRQDVFAMKIAYIGQFDVPTALCLGKITLSRMWGQLGGVCPDDRRVGKNALESSDIPNTSVRGTQL